MNQLRIRLVINTLKRWLPVLLWMGVIFLLSSRSNPYTYTPNWDNDCVKLMPKTAFWQEHCDTEYLGRVAHLGCYTILSLLLYRALAGSRWKSDLSKVYLGVFLLGWGYGWSDETHQLFVPGRTFQLLDLAIDLAGVTLGVLLIYLVRMWLQKKRLSRYKSIVE
jgi:VanZ family protein